MKLELANFALLDRDRGNGTWVNRADFSAVTVQVPRISRCRRKDAQCLERNACHLSTQSPATSTKGGK